MEKITLPREIVLTTNCSDEPVYAYVIDHMTIFNPTVSECGRFPVDPWEAYKLTEEQVNALHQLNKAHNFDDKL